MVSNLKTLRIIMANVEVKVYNESSNLLPIYTTAGAAAMDVCSNEEVVLHPDERKLVHTGLFMEIPEGYKINVLPRSGFAIKQGVTVLNAPGLIDHDYRGELMVILINHGKEVVDIRLGDRVAQIEIAPVYKVQWKIAGAKKDLSKTDRGTGGMGSTGVK